MRDVIVVGTSAGGVEALQVLAAGLPPGLPAAVFVVLHIPAHGPDYMPDILNRVGPLPAVHAADGRRVEPGRIYVAAPDHHLLLEDGRMRLIRGPKENRHRPAVDPLFRSAAVAYGPRVTGVILTGMLDDGAAGLWAVKDRGGAAVVQDPAEARQRSMPENALRQVRVDHVLRLAEMPAVLARLVTEEAGVMTQPAPEDMRVETRIALDDKALQHGVVDLGAPSTFVYPECHGVLMRHIAGHARAAGDERSAAVFETKAKEAEGRSELVRRAVMDHEKLSGDPPG